MSVDVLQMAAVGRRPDRRSDFPRQPRRAPMPRMTVPLILALGVVAGAAAGCSRIQASGSGNLPQAAQITAAPYVRASCFYSDVSGTDRIVGGRVLNWCG
jgi:hypothetical protein